MQGISKTLSISKPAFYTKGSSALMYRSLRENNKTRVRRRGRDSHEIAAQADGGVSMSESSAGCSVPQNQALQRLMRFLSWCLCYTLLSQYSRDISMERAIPMFSHNSLYRNDCADMALPRGSVSLILNIGSVCSLVVF